MDALDFRECAKDRCLIMYVVTDHVYIVQQVSIEFLSMNCVASLRSRMNFQTGSFVGSLTMQFSSKFMQCIHASQISSYGGTQALIFQIKFMVLRRWR